MKAQMMLSLFYSNGSCGFEKNLDKALNLVNVAVEAAEANADQDERWQAYLAKMRVLEEIDPEQAKSWFNEKMMNQ